MNALDAALSAWRVRLGEAHVRAGDAVRELSARGTYPTSCRAVAALRPADAQEVADALAIATAHRVPVYPVSRGRNWGYGSRTPSSDGAVLLELDRLAAITAYDEQLAYVTLEPGVTQRQLQIYLTERGGRLWMDPTSASPDASIVGNLMERGHGVSPYAERVAHVAGYEVALPTGDVIHTGYGAWSGSRVTELDPWGLGPSLDGLFTQSNLGVVTRVTLWLMPAPEHVEVAILAVPSDDAFAEVVDGARELRLRHVLRGGPFLSNAYQSIQKVLRYPWGLTSGATPLAPLLALRLAREHAFDLWNGSVALYGSAAERAVQRSALEALAQRAGARLVVMDASLSVLDVFPEARRPEVRAVVGGYSGKPAGASLPQGYWRMPAPAPAEVDMDRDRCGFKFTSVALPFRGADVLRASSIATTCLLAYGFEPSMGMVPARERALHCQITTAYDRARLEDDEAVVRAHDALTTALAAEGYLPARIGVGGEAIFASQEPQTRAVLARLKRALDPAGILAPDRYGVAGGPAGSSDGSAGSSD